MDDFKKVLAAVDTVFKFIHGSTWAPDSFNSVTHTLATLAAIGKRIDDAIKSGESNEQTTKASI